MYAEETPLSSCVDGNSESQTQTCICLTSGIECGEWSGSFSIVDCTSGCGVLRNGEGRIEERTMYTKGEDGICDTQGQERRIRCEGVEKGPQGSEVVVQDWCVKQGGACVETAVLYEDATCTSRSPSLPPSLPPSPNPPPPPISDEVIVAITGAAGVAVVTFISLLASRFLTKEQLATFTNLIRTIRGTVDSLTGKGKEKESEAIRDVESLSQKIAKKATVPQEMGESLAAKKTGAVLSNVVQYNKKSNSDRSGI